MKKIKYTIIGFMLGIIVIGSISVYAVTAVIESKEVSYDNKESHGNFTDVQGSIDELYKRSGVMKDIWVDPILHGADPVIGEGMIPVTIDDNGTVHYANLYTKWYEYETKRWANAVILVDSEKEKYKTGDTIPENAIESYFVWIPRYKYKIWDLGNYTSFYRLEDLKDSKDAAETESALRHISAKAQLIDIVFQNKEQKTTNNTGECEPDSKSGGGSNCHVGDYMTHPAFTLGEKELNGIWVGKFEITGDINNITVKPDKSALVNQTVAAFWKALYSYKKGSSDHNNNLDPHMIKNTEWGAIAYLSHSVYGIGTEVNINNNSDFKTGYSAAANTDQSTYPGTFGTGTNVTQPWNTSTGYLASTTGNITGVYDMSGGAWEYMAAYVDNYGVHSSTNNYSGFTDDDLSKYSQYFNKYLSSSNATTYNLRILGDATGEMGPFYFYFDKDGAQRYHNTWYADYSDFIRAPFPWFQRDGNTAGVLGGLFNFDCANGLSNEVVSTHIILTPLH